MDVIPIALERQGDSHLVIRWNDGTILTYAAAKLRDDCPCATCREKHTAGPTQGASGDGASMALPVLPLAEARPLSILHMRPVGNYAYNITFSDGHDSGIYTFDHLLQLGTPEN